MGMYNELSQIDIQKMQEEIEQILTVRRPKCVEDLQVARGFGDLSENYEYKVAKQELRRCDSRLRYLRRMIDTAKVIESESPADRVGLFDTVEVYFEDEGASDVYRIMTTLREDVMSGIISKESPLARAIMGHKVGERVKVHASDALEYYVQIRSLQKGVDDPTLPIHSY